MRSLQRWETCNDSLIYYAAGRGQWAFTAIQEQIKLQCCPCTLTLCCVSLGLIYKTVFKGYRIQTSICHQFSVWRRFAPVFWHHWQMSANKSRVWLRITGLRLRLGIESQWCLCNDWIDRMLGQNPWLVYLFLKLIFPDLNYNFVNFTLYFVKLISPFFVKQNSFVENYVNARQSKIHRYQNSFVAAVLKKLYW